MPSGLCRWEEVYPSYTLKMFKISVFAFKLAKRKGTAILQVHHSAFALSTVQYIGNITLAVNRILCSLCRGVKGRTFVGSLKRRVRSHVVRGEIKNCTPLWREAHFEVKMYKTRQLRTTF